VGELNHNGGVIDVLAGWVTKLGGEQNQGRADALASGIDEVSGRVLSDRIGVGGCRLELNFNRL
jgi:hypothetical protein